jgi:hypothetical protein
MSPTKNGAKGEESLAGRVKFLSLNNYFSL